MTTASLPSSNNPLQKPLLSVNIDHVATLRQARGVSYPSPLAAALWCEKAGADGIELHTGAYAEASLVADMDMQNAELKRMKQAVATARRSDKNLLINVGHGLTCDNVDAIVKIEGIYKLNINHAFIAGAVFVGLEQAVIMMKEAMYIELSKNVSGNLCH